MERTRDPVAGFTVVDLSNRVDASGGRLDAEPLRDAIALASAQGHPRLALDLTPVRIMDAEALGELVGAFSRLRRTGGDLVLVDPQDRVKRLLAVTRLDTVLPIWSRTSEPDAVADAAQQKPSTGWFRSRVSQGCDLLMGEGVTGVLSAATESLQFAARASRVVR